MGKPSNHTPGPWKTNYRRVTPVDGKQDGTDDICHVYGDEDTETANARLIAESPEMYYILAGIAAAIDPDSHWGRKIKEVMDRIEGE